MMVKTEEGPGKKNVENLSSNVRLDFYMYCSPTSSNLIKNTRLTEKLT
jgi:hypothetical protein